MMALGVLVDPIVPRASAHHNIRSPNGDYVTSVPTVVELHDETITKFTGAPKLKAIQEVLGHEHVSIPDRQRHLGDDPLLEIVGKFFEDRRTADNEEVSMGC